MSDSVSASKYSSFPDYAGGLKFASIQQVLEYSFDMYCYSPVLSSDEKKLSYIQLDEASSAFAAYVQATLNLEQGERVAISAKPSLASAIALCGAIKSGASIVLLDADRLTQAKDFFCEHRVGMLVAKKEEFFCSQRLQRFFQSRESIMSLSREGEVARTHSFFKVIERTDSASWKRPALAQQKSSEVFWQDSFGKMLQTSQEQLLELVTGLHSEAGRTNSGGEADAVKGFLKLVMTLLQGQSLDL